jgi:hypothetical protein
MIKDEAQALLGPTRIERQKGSACPRGGQHGDNVIERALETDADRNIAVNADVGHFICESLHRRYQLAICQLCAVAA